MITENILKAIGEGVTDYIVKPFTGATLEAKLKKVAAHIKRPSRPPVPSFFQRHDQNLINPHFIHIDNLETEIRDYKRFALARDMAECGRPARTRRRVITAAVVMLRILYTEL